MTSKGIDDNISIANYDNFYLISNSYQPTTYYYLGWVENNQTNFMSWGTTTSPIAFKDILNADNYNGVAGLSKKKQKT